MLSVAARTVDAKSLFDIPATLLPLMETTASGNPVNAVYLLHQRGDGIVMDGEIER